MLTGLRFCYSPSIVSFSVTYGSICGSCKGVWLLHARRVGGEKRVLQIYMLRQRTVTDGGSVEWWREHIKIHKTVETGGAGGD